LEERSGWRRGNSGRRSERAGRDARAPSRADALTEVKILKERALAIELSTYKQFNYSTSNDYRASEWVRISHERAKERQSTRANERKIRTDGMASQRSDRYS
jgi:hypothetical protein